MKAKQVLFAATLVSLFAAPAMAHERTDCHWVRGLYADNHGVKVYAQNHGKGRHMACGAAWNHKSLSAAKHHALKACSFFGHGCRIVYVSR